MKILKILAASMFVIFAITGCTLEQPSKYQAPAIVDISESKVVVQLNHFFAGGIWKNSATFVGVEREANRGCAQYNRKAKAISSRCLLTDRIYGCEVTNYLFACQEQ